jgi:hypothetical protein
VATTLRSSKPASRRWAIRSNAAKLSLSAKLVIAAGATWIALVLLSVVWFAPETFIGAMAAVLIGTVLLGSNATTWTQAEADLRAAEAMRADLIGRIDMRVVGEERPTLH